MTRAILLFLAVGLGVTACTTKAPVTVATPATPGATSAAASEPLIRVTRSTVGRGRAGDLIGVAYAPPRAAGGSNRFSVPSSVEAATAAFSRSAAAVSGARVRAVGANAFVVTYGGAPGAYVDCGVLSYPGASATPAAAATLQFPGTRSTRRAPILRTMRLDARVTVRFESAGGGAVATTRSIYVVTRRLDSAGVDGSGVSVMDFDERSTGRWRNSNTECRATGALERALFGAAAQ